MPLSVYATVNMRMVLPFLLVGAGGFVGSMLRYTLSVLAQRWSVVFPHGTLWANLLGCFLIGAVSAFAAKGTVLTPQARLLLATGLCGGFTTLSSFMYELFKLLQATEYWYASWYFVLTLAGCAAMFCLGAGAVGLIAKG